MNHNLAAALLLELAWGEFKCTRGICSRNRLHSERAPAASAEEAQRIAAAEAKRVRALMKLLADEKHKSEALEAELAGVRSDLAMCEAKGSSLQMRTDKADLLRVLGVADERIKALEALNARLANDINCGELLLADEKHKSEALAAELAALRKHLGTLTPGGSHTCITCAAHVLVITEDLEPRICELEAEVAEARRCLDGGTDCMDDKRKLRAALRKIAAQECIMVPLRQGGNCGMCVSCIARSALETACELAKDTNTAIGIRVDETGKEHLIYPEETKGDASGS
jgi:hypothetical protein